MGKQNADEEKIIYEYKRPKGKILPIIIVIIVTIAIGFFFYMNQDHISGTESGDDDVEIELNDNEIIVEEDFVLGLRVATLDRHEEAVGYFDDLNFENLSEDDQEIVLYAHLQAGEAQQALDLDESYDQEVVKHYAQNEKLNELQDLDVDTELINLEIAINEDDYESIIERKDIEGLELNKRQANAVAHAYFQLGDTEEAVNFTSLMSTDGMNMWNEESKVTEESNKTEMADGTNGSSSSGFINVIMLILPLLGIGTLGYFGYKYKGKLLPDKKEKKQKKVKKSKQKNKKEMSEEEAENVEGTDNSNDDKYSYHCDDENI